ncbi:MAG: hypothetical protein FWC43_06715, partial [Planctomycetaceae bacterium]|nr:hypothetical protein [Planctomycetaceae bacterium]
TEVLYFQGPLSTFLFHIPQKTYFFTHRFWWGTDYLSGSANRQEYLETAIHWISDGNRRLGHRGRLVD